MRLLDALRARRTPPAWTGWPPEAYASFGEGSWIVEPATVHNPQRIHIGARVVVQSGSWLSVIDRFQDRTYDPVLRIGDGTVLGHHIVIACMGEVTIGREVLTADRVFIGDTYHEYSDPRTPIARQPMAEPRPVRIGSGAFLGVGAIVLPGVSVGENGYVGAGAVVTADVPPRSIVVGNPARVVRRWDDAAGEWRDA